MKRQAVIEKMLRHPGIYVVVEFHPTHMGYFFVEVEADGTCHQLKPTTYKRDGILSRDGWDYTIDFRVHGPFARQEST